MQSRRNFGIALAIVAGVALTPSIAFAGCGDHVLIVNQGLHLDPSDELIPKVPNRSGQELPPPHCSGPRCSADPHFPIIPSGAPLISPPDLKGGAIRGTEVVKDTVGSFGGVILENDDELSCQSDPIFHPPRR
jgi:hypothetical protein